MIRRLTPADALLLRSVRRRALADSPSAFGSSLSETEARPIAVWENMLRPDGNPFFVYEINGEVRGLAGGFIPDHDEELHLVSMWIDPIHRGRGISDALVSHIVDWARSRDANRLILECTEGNHHAEELYVRHGFRRTGMSSTRERDGATEFEMVLDLSV